MAAQKAINSMTFEDALTELEGIVRNLESGKAPLEDSITAYERGTALKQHCETKLREAQAKIEKIVVGKDGKVSTKPLDNE
jgi:exodeoxyribonuclease VII small subunit